MEVKRQSLEGPTTSDDETVSQKVEYGKYNKGGKARAMEKISNGRHKGRGRYGG